MWATLALERSASSRRSAEALDETAGWSAAGRSRRVGGGRAVRPQLAREAWSTGAEVAGAPWQTRRPPPQADAGGAPLPASCDSRLFEGEG